MEAVARRAEGGGGGVARGGDVASMAREAGGEGPFERSLIRDPPWTLRS